MAFGYYISAFLCAYFVGSFPTAYLLLKIRYKKDIRTSGSGNVGALNALRSTKSKTIGLIVLAVDLLKGVIPVYLAGRFYPENDMLQIFAITGVLYGHCFPVWLKFKGGRGLASTAGALFVFQPLLVVFWVVLWSVYYIMIRRHIVANLIATFVLPLLVFLLQGKLFNDNTLLMILPVCLIILLRHLERIPDVIMESLDKN